MNDEKNYRIALCKSDGTTPIGEPLVVETMANNHYSAQTKVYQENPGYEIVSWGVASEIDAYEEKVLKGI